MPEAIIDHALSSGIERYIEDRLARIPGFVDRHYSFRGALRIHAHAFGWDLLRVPLNIVWSAVCLVSAGIGLLARLLGLNPLATLLARVPPGIETDMDREVKWLIVTDLLELPYADGVRESRHDALMEEILRDPQLEGLIDAELAAIQGPGENPRFWEDLDRKLAEYGATRTGAADLASNVMVVLSSKLSLGKVSYGALSAGGAVSVTLANSIAASNFWLGSTLGAYYYAVFPAAVSTRLLVAVTGVIVVLLAFVSTFIGVLTDPVQAKLGIHQRRLRKLVRVIERDLTGELPGELRLREKYLGKVFDVVDFLSVMGRSA